MCVRELSKLRVRDGCGGGRQEEAGGADGSAQAKTRTPQKDVGKYLHIYICMYLIYKNSSKQFDNDYI